MMKVLLILMCLVTLASVSFGQSSNNTPKPDLSGTWEFDAVHSNVGKSRKSSPEQIKVAHHDPKLIIRRKVIIDGDSQERDLTYYTDGRGERNPPTIWMTTNTGSDSFRPAETTSKTVWSKDKIVTRSAIRFYHGAAAVEFEIIEELRLSSDGKTLISTKRTIPKRSLSPYAAFVAGGGAEFKTVYKLISK